MIKRLFNSVLLIPLLVLFTSCEEPVLELPYLGNHDVVGNDTVYYQIPPFSFTDQNGKTITQTDIEGKVVVAEFFFTSCPTICPTMTAQMKRLQKLSSNEIVILSHTVDPERDTVERLKWYEENNGIQADNWHFLTGPSAVINGHGIDGYLIHAAKDEAAPGGYAHSEFFVLLDQEQHIRGYYDGTNTEEVDRLIDDIKVLLHNE